MSWSTRIAVLLLGWLAVVSQEPSHGYAVIEDFDDGVVDLGSYPGEDIDPDAWLLDGKNTYQDSPFALRLHGNTWKTEQITPVQLDSADVWEIAGCVEGSVEIQGFGLMDSANVLFYALAGSQMLDITTWVTVYQGAFPAGAWNALLLPVADDWRAYFGYLPRVDKLVFVCDNDGGGSGSASFDHVTDVTDDLPVAPTVAVTHTMGKVFRDTQGGRHVHVQFFATVTDPDSKTHEFSWDFGDDSTSTEQNPAHTYSVLDDHPYTVVLAVVDSTDRWGWGSCTVRVDPGPTTFPVTMNFVGDIMLARGYEQSGGFIPTQGVNAIFDPTLA
ncbi:MAG: PKD domain-containing protein, partial [Candidatus Eisenbacteria bacterium]|nr:PKD domain-containing protein [Candidatus Eisenbacteria bacterium]